MAKYTLAQMEQLWVTNGGNPKAAYVAAAVAMAESGGNSTSMNVNTNGTVDRGLWQINSVHGVQSTFDPNGNAKSAIAISKNGADWSAWVTFTSGKYKQFLRSAASAWAGIQAGKPTGTPVQGVSGPSGIAGSLDSAAVGVGNTINSVPDFLAYITGPHFALLLLGGILLVVAVVEVGSQAKAKLP